MLCVTWNIGGKSVWKRSSFKSLLSCRKKYNWADREPSTERKTQLSTESRSNKGRIIVSDFSFTISLTLNSHRHFNVSERKIIEKKGKGKMEKISTIWCKKSSDFWFSLCHTAARVWMRVASNFGRRNEHCVRTHTHDMKDLKRTCFIDEAKLIRKHNILQDGNWKNLTKDSIETLDETQQ